MAEWKKKVRHLNAAYKKLISDAKSQTTQTGRNGKKVFCEKWKSDESWSIYTYIRQNKTLKQNNNKRRSL